MLNNSNYTSIPSNILFTELFSYKSKGLYFNNKDVFLILDDIHGLRNLDPTTRSNFLNIFRSLKQLYTVQNSCLFSALAISNWVGKYLISITGQSPWNLTDSVLVPYFTLEQHKELFKQYETDYEIEIPEQIKNHIYSLTNGAPGLEQILGKYYHTTRFPENGEERQIDFSTWLKLTSSYRLHKCLMKFMVFVTVAEFLTQDDSLTCRKQLVKNQNINSIEIETQNKLQSYNVLRCTTLTTYEFVYKPNYGTICIFLF